MKNCTTCYWWTDTTGCRNTNWTSGSRTDPEVPVCGLLTPTSGAPMSWRPKKQERVLHPNVPKLNFRIIVPHAQGKLKDMPSGEAGIEIVRD